MPATVKLVFDELALRDMLSSPASAAFLSRKASQIAADVRKNAPRNRKGSWNSYVRNISIATWEDDDTGVVHAAVQADRHPIVVEFGWRHYITGKKYPGRYPMTQALMRAREE